MSLTLKIGSLAIRTLAKPVANYIKRNAREHERFRRLCINFAQRLHRIDMRMRLGLLQDPAVIDRQIQREVEREEARRKARQPPTAETKEEIEAAEARHRERIAERQKTAHRPPRIRPLSESKAIETGANFISESFMFIVAGGVILFETWRNRRKEYNRREDVGERLEELEQSDKEMREMVEKLQAQLATVQPQITTVSANAPTSSAAPEKSGLTTLVAKAVPSKEPQSDSKDPKPDGNPEPPDSEKESSKKP
ncbi:optic atrophy 3 protein-domain-containing protein [Lineolata rhizophorae]|uniref:Optic atrophy 3 protein-domain-containing protein n=1 Tax=Lineolata rhizophorae TaxID=578093 RepID=A0A6A6P7I7_9PEZI|nr:optic atrophy 3 protein-domain-containing protein [Lineolata rhizophorae]